MNANQSTTYTKAHNDNVVPLRQDPLTGGDPANPTVALISPGFQILTVKSFIRGLAVQAPLTISHTGGMTYLLIGMETSSISYNANASDVYTKAQVDNILTAKG